MRPTLSLKTLLRSPAKSVLTFLLIAAASFALFSRTVDYAVTERETERAASYYRGITALDNGVQNTAMIETSQMPNTQMNFNASYTMGYYWPSPLAAEQMETFISLPGVSGTDKRMMTAGVIKDFKRLVKYGGYNASYKYTHRFVVEGTYTGEFVTENTGTPVNKLQFTDVKILAGDPQFIPEGEMSVSAIINERASASFLDNGIGSTGFFYFNYPYRQDFVEGLAKGDRCLLIGRWWDSWHFSGVDDKGIEYTLTNEEARAGLYPIDQYPPSYMLGDQDTLDYVSSFHLLNDEPENYLETEKFAKVREIIEITNRDIHTFDMVYTSDMLSIPRFNEKKMVIQEGRALNKEDTASCVVNFALLEANGLSVGDKLTVELWDTPLLQHAEMGAVAVIPERYGNPAETVELTIVGAYTDTDAQYARKGNDWWCYSPSTIFVPSSLVPEGVTAGEIRPGEFSVIVEDAHMIDDFLEAASPLAQEMGLRLNFSDGGWSEVSDSIQTGKTSSLITAALYLGAAAAALLLAVYLFVLRGKKSYAIMRALGTPRPKARNALAIPLIFISLLAIPVGGGAGLIYASGAVKGSLESLAATMGHYIPDASLPMSAPALCLLCEIAFLLLISALFMRRLAKVPPLALLQSAMSRTKRVKKNHSLTGFSTPVIPQEPMCKPALNVDSMPLQAGGKYRAAKHVARYILRHMRRAGWKTAIAALLAAFLTGAMGLLALTGLSYQDLYDDVEVRGSLSNFPSNAVMEASRSELMRDFYYSGGISVVCNGIVGDGILLALTNDLDRYLQNRGTAYTLEYVSGQDSSFYTEEEARCVLGGALADTYGIHPGDSVTLLSYELAKAYQLIYSNPGESEAQMEETGRTFSVAGVIRSEDRLLNEAIFAPLSRTVAEISDFGPGISFSVETGAFTLSNKENPNELRHYLDALSNAEHKYAEAVTYNLDTAVLDNVKRVRDLLATLFPVAVGGAVLIGLTAPLLIIMQSAKEAAILRVLGTTKRRTRCILAIEQICLCVFGLILAAAGLVLYNPGLFVRSAEPLAVCGALYLLGCVSAAVFAALTVIRRQALELLQTKE
jgi:hypothetical protein